MLPKLYETQEESLDRYYPELQVQRKEIEKAKKENIRFFIPVIILIATLIVSIIELLK